MSDPGSRLERFIERAASLGSEAALHPATILQAVHDAALAAVRDGSMPNAYTVMVSPADYRALLAHVPQLRTGVIRMLDELVASRRFRRPGPWDVEFEQVQAVVAGETRIRVAFRNPAGAEPAPAGPTEAITRQRGKYLVVDGLGRVRLTHTPFTIGRAPGCDLVLHDLAVSRRHARIEGAPDGSLQIRDLGSRNKLVRDGAVFEVLPLPPGANVTLGSTSISLELEVES